LGNRLRGLLMMAATLSAGVLTWVAVGGANVARSFGYHLERGVEVGSVYAGGLIAAAAAFERPVGTIYRHKSLEVLSPWSGAVGALAFPAQAAALAATCWHAWRSRGSDRWRDLTAAVLAFVAFGKVLSPQYMIWLIPFAARLDGRAGGWARGVLLLACAVTTLLYPLAFHWLLAFRGWTVGLLNYRNALLVGLWVYLTFGDRADPAPAQPQAKAGRRTGRPVPA
jgi:hypothetical protein